MQKLVFILFTVCIFSIAQSQSQVVPMVKNDLASYAGSYKLVQGKRTTCPDGEFGAKTDAFVIGSDLRIDSINKPRVTELLDRIGKCKLQRQASYDGKHLKYLTKESCPKATDLIKEHVLEFSKTDTSKTIKLQFYKKNKSGQTYTSQLEYECLYTKDFKQNTAPKSH